MSNLTGSRKNGSTDGPLLEAAFEELTGIAVVPNGDWFVLELHTPRVPKLSHGYVTNPLKRCGTFQPGQNQGIYSQGVWSGI